MPTCFKTNPNALILSPFSSLKSSKSIISSKIQLRLFSTLPFDEKQKKSILDTFPEAKTLEENAQLEVVNFHLDLHHLWMHARSLSTPSLGYLQQKLLKYQLSELCKKAATGTLHFFCSNQRISTIQVKSRCVG